MKVQSLNQANSGINSSQKSFQGIKIRQSKQYKSLKNFCERNNYMYKFKDLEEECKKIENINMDLCVRKGENYPKFLEEIKDDIFISDSKLYNETVDKIFGNKKHNADILISPSDYKEEWESSKDPIRYIIPNLELKGNYIADKWTKQIRYRTYPRSKDPGYINDYRYFDIPLPKMILDIKKKILSNIIESNVQLANNSKY